MERFAVVGMGRFGRELAQHLAKLGAEVIAIDEDRQVIEDMRDRVTLAIAMDATDEQTLRVQGIDKVDAAIVGIGRDFEANLLATVTLKQLGIKRVISRAGTELQGQILLRTGADEVVYPTHESAHRWAAKLLAPHVIEQIELAEGHSLAQVIAPSKWAGHTIADLNLRAKHHVNIVAIKRKSVESEKIQLVMPMPDTRILEKDTLILIARDDDIEKLPV